MTSNFVSVIMPTHDSAPWIEDSINSVLRQTWTDLELIVVDDGSTDDSQAICAPLLVDPRVRWIRQVKSGAAVARNRGLQEARGRWIQFIDSDDLLAPDKIAQQMTRAVVGGDRTLYSGLWGRFRSDPASWTPDRSELLVDGLEPIDWLVRKYSGYSMIALHAWLIPRAIIDREGVWDETLTRNDDGEFIDRLVLGAERVEYVPEAGCYYRAGHRKGISRSQSRSHAESAARSIQICTGRLLAREDSARTRVACATQWLLLAYESLPLFPDLSRRAHFEAKVLAPALRLDLPGSLALKFLGRAVGWRLARRLQHAYRELRSSRIRLPG